jgi:fatty acid desaturase
MWEYATLLQFAKILLATQLLQAAGVPYANLCVYMAGAPLVAAVRLFYFGTYLPHLPPKGPDGARDASAIMAWQRSASSEAPAWLTFLQCYHFSLHFEHHRWPYAPCECCVGCRGLRSGACRAMCRRPVVVLAHSTRAVLLLCAHR